MERAEDSLRLFNVRYVPLFALSLILGIFTVKVSLLVAIILWVVAIFALLALFLTKNIKWPIALALVAVVFLGYGIARLELYYRNEVGVHGRGEVTCRVTSVSETEEGYLVTADKVSAGGKSFGGGVYFESEECFEVGDRVTFYGEIEIEELELTEVYEALKYRKGQKYVASVEEFRRVEEGAPPLSYTIKSGAKALLIENQGDRAGAFTYATIFGDADAMWASDKQSMREVGVAHVFAISGLHVAVLSGAILFLLRKLKVKDGVSLLILLPILGFYAYIVGFTPSVLRAAIMVSLSLLASHLGMRYDDLSALSFAAILLLLTRPLLLFDISFIMSFLSIFGIHSLASPLKEAFTRLGMKEGLAGALALSIAATLALVPVSALVFGRITPIGILLNLVVVPLASVSYVLSLVGLLLTAVIPSFGALLAFVGYLPLLISEVGGWAAGLGLSEKYDFETAEVVVYYATLAFVGKYSLASRRVKIVSGGMGLALLSILIFAI